MNNLPSKQDAPHEVSLLDIVVIISESFWLIIAGAVVAGFLAYAVQTNPPVVYESTAIIKPIDSARASDMVDSLLMMEFAAAEKELQSPALQQQALTRLSPDKNDSDHSCGVMIDRDKDGNLLSIIASAGSPERAQELAGVFVRVYAENENRSLEEMMVQEPAPGSRVSAGSARIATAVRSAFLAGVILLIIAFLRAAFRAIGENPATAPKLARIRKGILRS